MKNPRLKLGQNRKEAIQRLMHPRIAGVPGDVVLKWIREGRK